MFRAAMRCKVPRALGGGRREYLMSIKGLDVSEFQGEVDWERVKAAGYKFAMLRAGYGYDTVDKQFRRNASECKIGRASCRERV